MALAPSILPASPCSCLLRSSAPSEESVTRGLHSSSKDKLEISNAKNGPGLGAFSLLRLLHVGDIHPHHVVSWWLLLYDVKLTRENNFSANLLAEKDGVVSGRLVGGGLASLPTRWRGSPRWSVHHHNGHHASRARIWRRGGGHHLPSRLSPILPGGRSRSVPALPALSQQVKRGAEADPVPL